MGNESILGKQHLALYLFSILILSASQAAFAQTSAPGTISAYAGSGTTYNCPAFYSPPNCPQIGAYGFKGDGGPATSALLFNPGGIALDAQGDLFIADSNNGRIREVTPNGVISTIAGNGQPGFSGDGGLATEAALNMPLAVAVDSVGDVFVADWGNCRIREITPPGIIYTIAGNGTEGYSGDGGDATAAMLSHVLVGIAVDAAGNVYFSDVGNSRIRMVAPNGIISTVAGNGSTGYSGDGGDATAAALNHPLGIALDSAGTLFFVDSGNNAVRKVSGGTISTVFNGLNSAWGLAIDSSGNIFVANAGTNTVVKRSSTGQVSTVAGNGTTGPPAGDGGPAVQAVLYDPTGVAIDTSGNLFIVDLENSRVREVTGIAAPGVFLTPQNPTVAQPTTFAVSANGGISLTTSGTAEASEDAGYAEAVPNTSSVPPAGLAIFAFRNNGVLVSEATVPASTPIQSGRLFAEMSATVNTGVAIVNPDSQPATISFYFTDASGNNSATGTTTILPNAKIAGFLTEAPFSGKATFTGTFTFSSNQPVAVAALRGFINQRSDFLMTTTTVVPLVTTTAVSIFPHFADGGGWSTEIALVNPGDNPQNGTILFQDSQGLPVNITIAGQTNSSFTFSIPPRSSQTFQTAGLGNSAQTGSIVVNGTGSQGAGQPYGVAIFAFNQNGVTETEAAVPTSPWLSNSVDGRLYAEASGTPGQVGSVRTGIAIQNPACLPPEANPSLCGPQVPVTLTLYNLDGSATGLTGTVSIATNAHIAKFLDEIPGLSAISSGFKGVLEVSCQTPITFVGLRGRYNERGDFLITTTPAFSQSPATGPVFFPHIVDSGGYTTQIVLFSPWTGQTPTGILDFFSASGSPLTVVLR